MSKVAWFILGLILGCALGLLLATLTDRRDAAEPLPPEAPAVSAPAETDRLSPPVAAAPTARINRPAPRPRVHESADEDAQMAEDAAAAGMTSRARPSAAAPSASSSQEPAPTTDDTPG